MKPRIRKYPDGAWYFCWSDHDGLRWMRRCFSWSVAVEQMHRLYSMCEVKW